MISSSSASVASPIAPSRMLRICQQLTGRAGFAARLLDESDARHHVRVALPRLLHPHARLTGTARPER
jgi:hypothetical protein